jgi:hypothetical protein
MVLFSFDLNGNIDKNSIGYTLLRSWWNRDFVPRRRLYHKHIDMFNHSMEYGNFLRFLVFLDTSSPKFITDKLISSYIIADIESREKIVADITATIKRQQKMP